RSQFLALQLLRTRDSRPAARDHRPMTRDDRKVSSPRAVNIADLRLLAQRRLPKAIFDYVDGGSDGEITLRENVRAFEEVTFRPRNAIFVRGCEMRTKVFGC